jgi:metal-responsive CopG/Arc/MetJ family transcriptional regulator
MPLKASRRRTYVGVSLPPEIAERFDRERGLVNRSVWITKILQDRYGLSNNRNKDREDSAGALVERSTHEERATAALSYLSPSDSDLRQEARLPP